MNVVTSEPAPDTAGKWKQYADYKDSGVQWVGRIPLHWQARRLKFLASGRLKYGLSESGQCDNPAWPRFVRITDMADDGSLRPDVFASLPPDKAKDHMLCNGDLLFARSGATVGKTFQHRKKWGSCCFAGYLILCRPDTTSVDPDFLYLTTRSDAYSSWIRWALIQATIENVSAEKYANFVLALPPLDEQRAIAAFLDRETAKIDALLSAKERQIEFLREKRMAVISQALTKGLDPNVSLRDSHIEWLGTIPAHWEVRKLKRVGAVRYGLGQPPPEVVEGVPLIRATNVYRGTIQEAGLIYISAADVPEGKNAVIRAGEIIVVRSGAYTGDSAIVPEEYEGAIAGYDMVFTTLYGCGRYYAWQMLAPHVLDVQFYACRVRAAQPHLNAEELQETLVLVPPTDEQCAIANFLDSETARVDALTGKILEHIERLREYRTALVSAAVTGQIDVREEV